MRFIDEPQCPRCKSLLKDIEITSKGLKRPCTKCNCRVFKEGNITGFEFTVEEKTYNKEIWKV